MEKTALERVQTFLDAYTRLTEDGYTLQIIRAIDGPHELQLADLTAVLDLLQGTVDALNEMVALWDRVHNADGPVLLGRPTLNQARAAIAKATGKEGV